MIYNELMVTRFNTKTFTELQEYKQKHSITIPIYGAPWGIKELVPLKKYIIVFEMNNDTNKIMGISIIKNYIYMDKYYNIYEDRNYNRFVYKGKYRIDRSDLSKFEEIILKIFDLILFYGYSSPPEDSKKRRGSHMKRGQGISLIPKKKYSNYKIKNKNLLTLLVEMFKRRFYTTVFISDRLNF